MSERLTSEELRTIRVRAEKATAGEWCFYPSRLYSHDMVTNGGIDGKNVAEVKSREADGQFIAHARQDIPKLLAEVERMRALLNKAYQYGITSEAYQNDDDIKEIYEYLYGGESE